MWWNNAIGIGCWLFILLFAIMSFNVMVAIAGVLIIESSNINVNGEDGLIGTVDIRDGRSDIQALGDVVVNGIDKLSRELFIVHQDG